MTSNVDAFLSPRGFFFFFALLCFISTETKMVSVFLKKYYSLIRKQTDINICSASRYALCFRNVSFGRRISTENNK